MLWEAWARRVASGDSGECAAALEITPPVHNAQMQVVMMGAVEMMAAAATVRAVRGVDPKISGVCLGRRDA